MKKDNKLSITVGLIILVIGLFICFGNKHEFSLQYVNHDGNLETEVFESTKEFNERAVELKLQGIKYYKD